MNSLHFSVKGSKTNPALVFCHGFMGNSNDWGVITSALSDQYYCVSIDLPGHGMSQALRPNKRHGFRQVHRLLEYTLKQLGIHEYVLIGYNLGGRLAAFHASLKPKGLKALVLESTHLGLTEQAQRSARLSHDQKWADKLRSLPFLEVLEQWYNQPVFTNLSEQERQYQIETKKQYQGQFLADMLEATSLALQDNLVDKLIQSSIPITFIIGEQDTSFVTMAEQLIDQMPNAHRHQIPKAGHNTHAVQPGLYIQYIRDFLSQIEFKKN